MHVYILKIGDEIAIGHHTIPNTAEKGEKWPFLFELI